MSTAQRHENRLGGPTDVSHDRPIEEPGRECARRHDPAPPSEVDLALLRSVDDLRADVARLRAELKTGKGEAGEKCGQEEGELVSTRELADLAGFSVHTVRDWCEQGLLPARKIGNRWRLDQKQAMMSLKHLNRKRRRKRDAKNPT